MSVYIKLDKMGALSFTAVWISRRSWSRHEIDRCSEILLSTVKFCLFFHVNAYACIEILLCSEKIWNSACANL